VADHPDTPYPGDSLLRSRVAALHPLSAYALLKGAYLTRYMDKACRRKRHIGISRIYVLLLHQ
jgi:hypothetical protein